MSREQWGHGYYRGFSDGIKAKISFENFCQSVSHDNLSEYQKTAEDILKWKSVFPFPKSPQDTFTAKMFWIGISWFGAVRLGFKDFEVMRWIESQIKAFNELINKWEKIANGR